MSLIVTHSDAVPRARTDINILLLIVWTATVATYLLTGRTADSGLSTDDAMRLVQVRDFLAWQGWFDLTQYRLAPSEGVPTHWSRLIDLPLAALIRLGEGALPAALAERMATIVWPAALLLAFLAGVARLARELAGDPAARLALIFAALTAPVLQHFRPGAIDHHNVQLVLLVWSLVFAVRVRPRDGAFAGALCALSLAIGQEMAPAIATLAAALALRWIMRGEAARQATAAFGLAFAGVTLALFAATVPPVRYSVATCDALSIVQGTAAAIGGVGLAGLTAVRALTSRSRRLVAAAALGLLLGATMAFGFPACLGDPYAHLDPRISALWLSNVTEARNIVAMLRDLPQEVLPYYGLLATGFVLGLIRCAREPDDERWRWIVCFAVLATLSALSLWQVRGSASANTIAVALTPAALVRSFPAPDGRAVFLGLGRAALVAALLLNPLLLIAVGNVSARVFDAATGTSRPLIVSEGPGTCSRAADYAPLARLPRGRVLGFIDAGPFILAETPHDVFAAPYHRNVKGNAAMLDIFLARPDHAAARLAALEIDYIAFCPGAPERHNYVAAAPDGLAAALARGEVPEFLERVALDGTDLAVYRRRR